MADLQILCLHMKRIWNQSADRLGIKAFQQEQGSIALFDQDRQDLCSLNQLDEISIPKSVSLAVN